MMQGSVHVFAKALFGIGKGKGVLDSLHGELEAFVELLRGNSELDSLLKTPRLTKEEKKKLLKKIGTAFSKDFLAFVWVVVLKGGQGLYPMIQKAFQELYDRDRGILRAKVFVAKELTSELANRIKKQIEDLHPGRRILLEEKVKPSILGGMILEIEDSRVDLSILQQLKGLEKRLEGFTIGRGLK